MEDSDVIKSLLDLISQQNNQIIDRLFWWYTEQNFPTDRFDDLSPMPKQIRVKAMSPLCHTSVSKWTVAAGATIKSEAKIERCAKVAGEVAYTVTLALNEFVRRQVEAAVEADKEVWHCVGCHGPDTALAPSTCPAAPRSPSPRAGSPASRVDMADERRPPAVARVLTQVTATVRKHEMFEPRSLVLVAVSGGPDACACCTPCASSAGS